MMCVAALSMAAGAQDGKDPMGPPKVASDRASGLVRAEDAVPADVRRDAPAGRVRAEGRGGIGRVIAGRGKDGCWGSCEGASGTRMEDVRRWGADARQLKGPCRWNPYPEV
jgi:hypothetical protein